MKTFTPIEFIFRILMLPFFALVIAAQLIKQLIIHLGNYLVYGGDTVVYTGKNPERQQVKNPQLPEQK